MKFTTLIYMQMADLDFTFEIHHGGTFVWDPDLVYLFGNVSTIDNINPIDWVSLKYKICVLGYGQLVLVDFITLFLEVIWSDGWD